MNKWLSRFIPTMAIISTTAAVLLSGVHPAHAETSASPDATAYTVPKYTSGLGHGPLRYNGVDLFDIACLLDGDDLGCVREWGDTIINTGLCAVSLFGFGKVVSGLRLLRKIRKMEDAAEKADARKAMKGDFLQGLLSFLFGECWDAYWAVQDLMDCMDAQAHQEDALVMFHRRFGENLKSEAAIA